MNLVLKSCYITNYSGKIKATVEYNNEYNETKLILAPEASSRILYAIAEEIILASKEVANTFVLEAESLKHALIEQTK